VGPFPVGAVLEPTQRNYSSKDDDPCRARNHAPGASQFASRAPPIDKRGRQAGPTRDPSFPSGTFGRHRTHFPSAVRKDLC
jgi:hypothetical protein